MAVFRNGRRGHRRAGWSHGVDAEIRLGPLLVPLVQEVDVAGVRRQVVEVHEVRDGARPVMHDDEDDGVGEVQQGVGREGVLYGRRP